MPSQFFGNDGRFGHRRIVVGEFVPFPIGDSLAVLEVKKISHRTERQSVEFR
jgi:hypothetical protein